MNGVAPYARALIARNPRRILVYLLGLTLAVGLLSSVLYFVDGSAHHMMATALKSLPVDMQVVATDPQVDLGPLQSFISRLPHVRGVARFDLATFAASELVQGDRRTTTTSGALIAVRPRYRLLFSSLRVVQGGFDPRGIMISKDLATNLGARPGDTLTLRFRAPVQPVAMKVTGIVDLTGSDLLFAPTDPAHRAGAFNPPANVAIMDLGTFRRELEPSLAHLSGDNSSTPGIVSSSQPAVSRQIHVSVDRSALPLDPGTAEFMTTVLARSIEKKVPGRVVVLNNMYATLAQVGNDLLWAQIILLFLAVPGIVLAGYLSRYAAGTWIEAQRCELALLRARGATPSQIVAIVAAVSLATALGGAVLGLAIGLLTNLLLLGAQILRPGNLGLLINSGLIALVAGVMLAATATFIPLRALYQEEIRSGRQSVRRSSARPLWHRLYLDFLMFAAGAVVLWLTQRNGFAPVVGGEGQVTLSLSIFTFLAPLLIWVGAVLILARLGHGLVTYGTRLFRGILQTVFKDTGVYIARSISRRSQPLVQPALIIALALSFGIGLGIFGQTYRHQQLVDARLTLGADVVATPQKGHARTAAFARQLSAIPGVASVSPFTHAQAYVGTEIQDIFGIDPKTFLDTTHLADTFFVGQTASQAISQLAATRNGILISPEMAQDYNIAQGDTVKIRLLDQSTNTYHTTPFQVIGAVQEFSTAPKDAFLVVNRDFLDQQIGSPDASLFLIRTDRPPRQVAAAIATKFGPHGLSVQSIHEVAVQLATSITSINLTDLLRLEWAYIILITSLGMMIFLLGIFGERRREYAVLEALGASRAQVRSFLIAEAGLGGLIGLSIGVIVGFPLGQVFVSVLTALFDPPPSHPYIPWVDLSVLLGLSILGILAGMALVAIRLKRLQPAQLLREL